NLAYEEDRRAAEAARLRQNQEAARRQHVARLLKRAAQARKPASESSSPAQPSQPVSALPPLPPVPVRLEPVDVPFQESAFPLNGLTHSPSRRRPRFGGFPTKPIPSFVCRFAKSSVSNFRSEQLFACWGRCAGARSS